MPKHTEYQSFQEQVNNKIESWIDDYNDNSSTDSSILIAGSWGNEDLEFDFSFNDLLTYKIDEDLHESEDFKKAWNRVREMKKDQKRLDNFEVNLFGGYKFLVSYDSSNGWEYKCSRSCFKDFLEYICTEFGNSIDSEDLIFKCIEVGVNRSLFYV